MSLSSGRDAFLYVPKPNGDAVEPTPLAGSLHGAGGNERHGIDLLRAQAEALGVVLLSPASRRQTWDIIVDDFGPDVEFIDRALECTFEMCSIDPARVAIGGFSDGAWYALSLGLPNGDLFTHILAFSAGLRHTRPRPASSTFSYRMVCGMRCSRLSAAAAGSCRR